MDVQMDEALAWRLLISFCIGTAIGFEREYRSKAAGLRTMIEHPTQGVVDRFHRLRSGRAAVLPAGHRLDQLEIDEREARIVLIPGLDRALEQLPQEMLQLRQRIGLVLVAVDGGSVGPVDRLHGHE